MSRCFPFPPPGYVKEARTDNIDLLKKEKHKEKKHKKEKKDKKREGKEKKDKEREGKEKKDKEREGKEKKDKERGKDKHRDKKERKEKRKEKKKDKSKKDKSKVSDENKNEGQLQVNNGGKIGDNMQNAVQIKDSKFVEEFCRRIGDEGGGSTNHMVENFTNCDNRKAEGVVRVVEKDINNRVQGRENKDQKRDYEKTDNKRNRDEERGGGNAMVQNFTVLDQRRVGGMVRQVEEKNVEKRIQGKEKNKELGIDNKQRNGHKVGDREKKSTGEDKSKEKGKMTVKVENDKKHDIVREGGRDLVATLNSKPLHVPKNVDKNSVPEGNLKKRKEHEPNGFLYGNDVRPNKLPRPAISQPFMENGRTLEPCQAPMQHASSLHGGANNLKVDKKAHKINGLIDAQQPSAAIKASSSSATASKASDNGVEITKPSHPDSKFLNQILSVPKMEEWSEFDDQEWLFTSDSHQSEKHKQPISSSVDETAQVWDKALQIQSDDVCALPYVIPY